MILFLRFLRDPRPHRLVFIQDAKRRCRVPCHRVQATGRTEGPVRSAMARETPCGLTDTGMYGTLGRCASGLFSPSSPVSGVPVGVHLLRQGYIGYMGRGDPARSAVPLKYYYISFITSILTDQFVVWYPLPRATVPQFGGCPTP